MPVTRRRLLIPAVAALAITAIPRPTRAQVLPSRHGTLVVPVGAGGAPDLFARILADALSQRLGQPFVVENRPGAGGTLALQAVARAEPNGSTVLLMTTPHAAAMSLYPDLGIALERDIAPVTGLAGDNFVLIASPGLPVTSLADLITYAKANPRRLNMASSGAGNMSHLTGELFQMVAGVSFVHVPYRSAPAAQADLMSGTVQIAFDAIPSARPLIEAGKLKALATTGRERHPLLPDLPAVAEVVPGFEVSGWMGLGVPRATPATLIERLGSATSEALADPALRARLDDLGSTKIELSRDAFARVIAADIAKWAEVVRFAGIRVR